MAELSDAEVFGMTPAPAAAPREMSDADVFGSSRIVGTGVEGYPEEALQNYYARPSGLPVPAAVAGMSAYREPGTDLTDIEPRGAPSRILDAAAEGWRGFNPESPERAAINQESYIGQFFTHPLVQFGSVPFRALGAAGAGVGQAAYEVGNVVSPELGRDAYMGAQVLNALAPQMAGPRAGLQPPVAPRVNPMMEAFDRAEAMRAEQPSRPALPDPVASNIARVQSQIGVRPEPAPSPDTAPPGVPPGMEVPVSLRPQAAPVAPPAFVPPGSEAPPVPPAPTPTVPYAPAPPAEAPAAAELPGPRSVGAAASRDMTNPAALAMLTPEQEALYGSVADKQWLYKSMQPGVADNTEYVPGITPTMAQREQTVQAARDTKTARNLSKEADQAERELLDEHNTIRKNEFQNLAGSDVTQGIAIDFADKAIDNGLAAAFRAGGTVDPEPIVGAIQAERNRPSGKLPPVKAVMNVVSDAMRKEDGSGLETDPTQVYGVRRVITYLQSKNAIAENPAYGSPDVQAALIRVKNAIDGAIETPAPGFRQAIAQYSEAQRAIDANEALQKAEPKLYDDKGRMQYSRFHRFMNEVIQSRDPRAPLNPYQSFTEAQMNRLKSLHDDLFRVTNAEDLARAKGSDTAMNFMDAIKEAAQGVPGTLAAGLAGHVIGGPAGIVMGPAIKQGVQGVFTRRAERAATQKMQGLLRPDPVQYPTRPNPLFNPDAAP
jgi:hypothetical protein